MCKWIELGVCKWIEGTKIGEAGRDLPTSRPHPAAILRRCLQSALTRHDEAATVLKRGLAAGCTNHGTELESAWAFGVQSPNEVQQPHNEAATVLERRLGARGKGRTVRGRESRGPVAGGWGTLPAVPESRRDRRRFGSGADCKTRD